MLTQKIYRVTTTTSYSLERIVRLVDGVGLAEHTASTLRWHGNSIIPQPSGAKIGFPSLIKTFVSSVYGLSNRDLHRLKVLFVSF
jgi:hypothetical protein